MLRRAKCARCLLAWIFVLKLASTSAAQVSPEEELKRLQAAAGMEVGLFAAEPLITNPAAIDVDTHGRVWVAEIQWYRGAAKNPPADKLKVLEDTDGDGRADRATVFAEGLFCPMSVCVAGDKVYVATSPDLWVYEDRNGDLKADGPPRKLLSGFGGHNHDHGAHSLVLGPDHKWWMSHGDGGFDVTGTDGSRIKYQWGAMLRGELDGRELETVAVNFRNPYELCVSSFGEAFCSDNDNDGNQSARICWILEGGNYGWFGAPPARVPPGTPFAEHWHFRGHIPGFVPATLVTGFGSPCGICFYEGDAFGPRFKNAPLHCDPGPRELRIYRHLPAGAGMKATSEVFLTTQADPYFRPDDICAAPDGRLYVADWYDGGVGGHAYNNPYQGRIFVLKPTTPLPARPDKPGPYANVADAVQGLKSPNLATQFLARERLLAEGPGSVAALRALLDDAEPNYRARALWVLDRIGGEARQLVVDRLASANAPTRALAVRILRRRGPAHADAILRLADDPAAEVRREVLLALAKLTGEQAEATLARMAAAADLSDRYLLEAIHVAAGAEKNRLYARLEKSGGLTLDRLPLLQLLNPKAAAELLAARLAQSGGDPRVARSLLEAAGNSQSIEAGRAVLSLLADDAAPANLRKLALDKLLANLAGPWKTLADEKSLAEVLRRLLASAPLTPAALAAIGQLHLRELSEPVLALARSSEHPLDVRIAAVRTAVNLRGEGTAQALRALAGDRPPELRSAALDGLVDLQDARALREVLQGDVLPLELRRGVVERLMESLGGALVLLRMIDDSRLPEDLRQRAVARAAAHVDPNVRALYEKLIPEAQRPERLGSAIKAEEILALRGDAARGERVFNQSSAATCRSCHAIRGAGGQVGPDLSLIGKKYERAALLETILAPSKAIAPEFVPHLVETDGGQVFVGFLVSRDDKELVLKDAKAQSIRVPAAEVAALAPQKTSLMPELALRDVTAQDAADLLAFLMTLNQGDQSAARFRILGPFDAHGRSLDAALAPERQLAAPDLKAEYAGISEQKNRWELAASDGSLGFAGIDTVKFDQRRGLRASAVAHYLLLYVDSPIEQPAKLLVGSDDGCKLWLNGRLIHRHEVTRALAWAQDVVDAPLRRGRNVVLMKVVNGNPPGGAALGVRATTPVELRTE